MDKIQEETLKVEVPPTPIEEDSNLQEAKKEEEEIMTPTEMERMKRADFLGNGPIGPTIWKMTYPDLIAKIVGSLYNVADSIFIGQFAGSTVEEKKNSLAGVALASPVENCVLVGLSLIFAQGGGPLYGRFLGKKDKKTAGRIIGNVFFMDICLGILIATILPLFARPILLLLGASEKAKTLKPAMDYILPLMYCDILYNVCYGTNNLMRGEGAALYSCTLMIISSLCNIFFDLILLRFFNLGTRGAAIATCIAYTCSSSFGLWYFATERSAVSFQWKNLKPNWKLIGNIMNTGLPGMVIGLANGILTIVSNQLIIRYSPDPTSPEATAAIAAAGNVARMQHFCFIPINSIAHGVLAMLSFCRGSGLYKRFVTAMKYCFVGQIIVCLILTVICECFAPQLATLFNSDPEFIRIFTIGLRFMASSLCFSPFSCTLYPGLQTIGRGFGAAVVLMCRSCIFIIIAQLLLCYFLQDYWGVFYAYPIADACSALFASCFFLFVKKDLYGQQQQELPVQK